MIHSRHAFINGEGEDKKTEEKKTSTWKKENEKNKNRKKNDQMQFPQTMKKIRGYFYYWTKVEHIHYNTQV